MKAWWYWGWLGLCLVGCMQMSTQTVPPKAALPAAVYAPTAVAPTLTPTVLVTATAPPSMAHARVDQPTVQPSATATSASQPATLPPSAINDHWSQAAASVAATFVQLDSHNSGHWQYAANSFVHPIALTVWQDTAFLLDAGRILAFDLTGEQLPQVLLQKGNDVAGVRVLEPLDLTLVQNSLLVLDRAGDVYRHNLITGQWVVERHDRASGETAAHYYAALSGDGLLANQWQRYILDINYEYMIWTDQARQRLWYLPEGLAVDVSAWNGRVHILSQNMADGTGTIGQYDGPQQLFDFAPNIQLTRPREVVATAAAVYVLDHAGSRLLQLHPHTGQLITLFQLPPESSTFWTDGSRLIVAGRDSLYLYGQPQPPRAMPGYIALPAPLPHDTAVLQAISPLYLPIHNSPLTTRDFQMPGAPRHYRLGIHEGLDFYWGRGTPVEAVADGMVIKAERDYERPSVWEMQAWQEVDLELGYTSDQALNFYRGRQVWIQHKNGLISRYAHLDELALGIEPGVTVATGQWLGNVGNSGSPRSINSQSEDAHLHLELAIGLYYHFGQYLRPVEIHEWVSLLFDKKGG